MAFGDTINHIKHQFGENIVKSVQQADGLMPILVIEKTDLLKVCEYLYTSPELYFDYLSCITAVDNGAEAATIDIVYNLYSIPFDKHFCLKVILERNPSENENLPEIESVTSIWRTANWHEREAFDLVGVKFVNHPDLRRILLPADWEGHPLRKDYNQQEIYHSIKVAY